MLELILQVAYELEQKKAKEENWQRLRENIQKKDQPFKSQEESDEYH